MSREWNDSKIRHYDHLWERSLFKMLLWNMDIMGHGEIWILWDMVKYEYYRTQWILGRAIISIHNITHGVTIMDDPHGVRNITHLIHVICSTHGVRNITHLIHVICSTRLHDHQLVQQSVVWCLLNSTVSVVCLSVLLLCIVLFYINKVLSWVSTLGHCYNQWRRCYPHHLLLSDEYQ